MFDQLNKYRKKGHFFFSPAYALQDVCNAPADRDGVYLVYELKLGRIRLMYIGSSGEKMKDLPVSDGQSGLKAAIVNGPPAELKNPRQQAWPVKLLSENIDALDIYWWAPRESYGQGPACLATTRTLHHKLPCRFNFTAGR